MTGPGVTSGTRVLAWTKEKLPLAFFLASLMVHVIVYWILLFAIYMREAGMLNSYLVDFYWNYMEAVETFLDNPALLYASEQLTTANVWTFRNLPAGLFYFIPFHFLPSDGNIDLLVYSSCTLCWNMLACAVITKLARSEGLRAIFSNTRFNNGWYVAGLYLLSPHHVGEYTLGQTNVIAGFFILLGLFMFVNGKEHYAFACVSISLYFKISGLFLFFLLPFCKDRKIITRSIFYSLLVQGPNVMMFLSWQNMLVDFIILNVLSGEAHVRLGYRGWGTGSTGTLSVFFTHNFNAPLSAGTLAVLTVLIPAVLFTLHARGNRLNVLDKWILLILSFAIAVPIFYTVHVFMFLGIFCLWLMARDDRKMQTSKLVLAIPTYSMFIWFFFPLIPFLFVTPVIMLLVKAWHVNVNQRERPLIQPATMS